MLHALSVANSTAESYLLPVAKQSSHWAFWILFSWPSVAVTHSLFTGPWMGFWISVRSVLETQSLSLSSLQVFYLLVSLYCSLSPHIADAFLPLKFAHTLSLPGIPSPFPTLPPYPHNLHLSIFFLWISAQFKYYSSLKLFSCPPIPLFLLWILNLESLSYSEDYWEYHFLCIHFSPLIQYNMLGREVYVIHHCISPSTYKT